MKRKFNLSDIAILMGCLLICIGIWMIYPPAAFIVAGLLMVAGAILLYKPK